jgi:hypothetical protein
MGRLMSVVFGRRRRNRFGAQIATGQAEGRNDYNYRPQRPQLAGPQTAWVIRSGWQFEADYSGGSGFSGLLIGAPASRWRDAGGLPARPVQAAPTPGKARVVRTPRRPLVRFALSRPNDSAIYDVRGFEYSVGLFGAQGVARWSP